jgi:hypothetical protein
MTKVRKRTWSNAKGEQTAWIADYVVARNLPNSDRTAILPLHPVCSKRCAAALGAVLAFGATAAHSADNHRDLHIVIETIDHSRQRYPTVGDWQLKPDGIGERFAGCRWDAGSTNSGAPTTSPIFFWSVLV